MPFSPVLVHLFLKSFDCCKLQNLLVVSFTSAKAILLAIYSASFVKLHSVFVLNT